MKRVLLMVCSICLVLACLFGLFACVAGMKDALNIQEYKQEDADHAREGIATARDGIKQLQENEDVYLNGVGTYEAGLIELSSGKSALNAGYKEYYAGKKALEEGKKAYAEGVKALEAGKKEYEAGKKKIAENTQAYNEGKEKLAKIEPLMPYLNQYVQFRDGTIAKLPGFDSAQAWFVNTVRPIAANLGITIPDDVTDFPAFMNKMVADGKAQLKEYEDGVAKLAEAEKTIAAGEKKLAAGEKELKAGAAKLADGKASLEEFENGMALVDEYTMTCYKNKPIYRHNGDMAVPGPEQRLGEDFSWYKVDDNGNVVTLRNGDPYLDLDQCLVVCKTFRESVADHVADVTHELYMRLGLYIALVVASLLGLIAGILGLAGKGGAATLGIITAVLAVACNIFGACTRYYGYTYPLKDGTYSGTLQFIALIAFAVVAVVFTIAACSAKSKAKAEAAAAAAE